MMVYVLSARPVTRRGRRTRRPGTVSERDRKALERRMSSSPLPPPLSLPSSCDTSLRVAEPNARFHDDGLSERDSGEFQAFTSSKPISRGRGSSTGALLTTLRVCGAEDAAKDGRLLPPAVGGQRYLPRSQVVLSHRVPSVPHCRTPAAGHRHQRRDRRAHHGHDPARLPGSGSGFHIDVHRPGTPLPAGVRRREPHDAARSARGCRAPGRSSGKIPRKHA